MTPEEVKALVERGETLTVEFKRGARSALSDDLIVDAVACLANGEGGVLLLGVEDDGRITGLEPRRRDRTHSHLLQAMILNRTEPPVAVRAELVHVDGLEIGVIDVPAADMPVGTSRGKYLRRRLDAIGEPQCVPYPLHEMLSAGLAAQGRDYAATPARGATWEDIDQAEIDRFRKRCGSMRGDRVLAALSDEEILRALRLSARGDDPLTLGAILLFGTASSLERFIPTAEVVFTELKRGDIVFKESIRLPLFQAADRLYDLIDSRNDERELMFGLHRVGVPRIPIQVVRESIANALVHRDYALVGPTVVQLDEEVFRVTSRGGFPEGITLQNLLEESRPRSPILAEAFKRAGIVDRAGRGVPAMYDQLLRAGRSEPDYSRSTYNSVSVSVPSSESDIETVRFVLEHEESTGAHLSLLQLRVIHELKSTGPQSVLELAEGLREPESRIRMQLTKLGEAGVVEARGTGRHRRNHLTAAFYRIAQSSEYVRLQDTDPIQQDRMVMAYVEQYGSITRGKVAELCRLGPEQAKTVLRRLVDGGQLEMRGQRRTAHYVSAGSPGEA
ncbi:RNA-binding domain-containing protein [Gulosibacter sp. 10]|uniref:RNA-binding domain-containing protein n=1 Tax=Gulosibacter sp. 10 TaxID=1255570 RepID=UPI000B358521|nr:RNA-binding domain-containing protein [Gulosibacter sp. 10]